MLKHFHAGYDIKCARLFCSKLFGTNFPVIYALGLGLKRMKLSYFQSFVC